MAGISFVSGVFSSMSVEVLYCFWMLWGVMMETVFLGDFFPRSHHLHLDVSLLHIIQGPNSIVSVRRDNNGTVTVGSAFISLGIC